MCEERSGLSKAVQSEHAQIMLKTKSLWATAAGISHFVGWRAITWKCTATLQMSQNTAIWFQMIQTTHLWLCASFTLFVYTLLCTVRPSTSGWRGSRGGKETDLVGGAGENRDRTTAVPRRDQSPKSNAGVPKATDSQQGKKGQKRRRQEKKERQKVDLDPIGNAGHDLPMASSSHDLWRWCHYAICVVVIFNPENAKLLAAIVIQYETLSTPRVPWVLREGCLSSGVMWSLPP